MREPISLRQRFRILMRDHFTCMYCGRRPPYVILNVDHYMPVASGGSGEDNNLITSCRDCNAGKHDIVPAEKYPAPSDGHYWKSERCTCERPVCGGEVSPRDLLENNCGCDWCHGCRVCGERFCPLAKSVTGGGECWSASSYIENGNESWLKEMKPEDAESCRRARASRIAKSETEKAGN